MVSQTQTRYVFEILPMASNMGDGERQVEITQDKIIKSAYLPYIVSYFNIFLMCLFTLIQV